MEDLAKGPRIVLFDDGTLDTVIGCADCGRSLTRANDDAWDDGSREEFIVNECAMWAEMHDCPMSMRFGFGQRIVLANYQDAVITGIHPANTPIIRSGTRSEWDRERYDELMYSVTWQDTIGVVVTMTYDHAALLAHGNKPTVDRFAPEDAPVSLYSTAGT